MKHALLMLYGWCRFRLVALLAVGSLIALSSDLAAVVVYSGTQSSGRGTISWKVERNDGVWTFTVNSWSVTASPPLPGPSGQVWFCGITAIGGSDISPAMFYKNGTQLGGGYGGSGGPESPIVLGPGFYRVAARVAYTWNPATDYDTFDFEVVASGPDCVTVQVVNNDDRTWTMTFDGEEGPRQVVVNAGASGQMKLDKDELPDVGRPGRLVTSRKMNELHSDGSWYLSGGQFRDPKDPANDVFVYETGYNFGPLSASDAKDGCNVVTITIPQGTAKDMPNNGLLVDTDGWEVPTPSPSNPTPQAPSQDDNRNNPNRPSAELARAVNQFFQGTIDPTTGETRLTGYFEPIIPSTEPTSSDGAAIIETLSEMQKRSEKMHQLGILQGEGQVAVAKGQLDAMGLAGSATAGMGGEGTGAGVAAGDLFADPPSGLGYVPGGGTQPNFLITMPAAFGGASFDFNPFTSDRFAGVASWFRSAVHWLAIVTFGAWVWSELAQWVRGVSVLPQAKGNAVVGGTGAQATALVAAGLMTTAVVVAITAILAWSFGSLTVPALISTAMGNPVTSMPGGALWMLDQLFPIGTLLVCLVGKLSFNMYAAGLFATCAAVIRFIVP